MLENTYIWHHLAHASTVYLFCSIEGCAFEAADTKAFSNTDMATVAPAAHSSAVSLQYILAPFHLV
jgi:hypothetical protein